MSKTRASPRALNERAIAARTVAEVIGGRSLDDALNALTPAARTPFVQSLCYGCLRWWWPLQAISAHFVEKPLKNKDRDVLALLYGAWFQLLWLETPVHAAVNETVAAADDLGKSWAKNLLNAVLRAGVRAGNDALRALAEVTPEARYSHPAWLLQALARDWPQDWQALCAANNAQAPMHLRVNRQRLTRDDYLAALLAQGLDAHPVPAHADAVTLVAPVPVNKLPGFAEGWVSVQDLGAQWAAPLLNTQPAEAVLDACAAPGGKAAHIAERTPSARVTALDIDAGRLQRVRETAQRLHLDMQIAQGDAAQPQSWHTGAPYDRILCDAPCSGTGVIRRHPDIKIHRRADDIPALARRQAQILDGLWPLLRSGGTLVYATCSILKMENAEQIAGFLARHDDAIAKPFALPDSIECTVGRQLLPGVAHSDGFYYAVLQKR